jgi:branched-chain amino acid transport system ATP-binding protein
MTALLELRDVVAYYGDFQALFGVSFEVRPNEVLALLGGNGAGKTTCLRVISGLLRRVRARCTSRGRTSPAPHRTSSSTLGIAHVPEARQLFPEMTVEENLYLGSHAAAGARHRPPEPREDVRAASPALGERRKQLAGRSPAASSRWWPSAGP